MCQVVSRWRIHTIADLTLKNRSSDGDLENLGHRHHYELIAASLKGQTQHIQSCLSIEVSIHEGELCVDHIAE